MNRTKEEYTIKQQQFQLQQYQQINLRSLTSAQIYLINICKTKESKVLIIIS